MLQTEEDRALDWNAIGAIGEALGSVGVLMTLIYFGLQIRRSDTAMQSATTSTAQVARLMLNEQRLQLAELLLKANSGSELTDLERSRLQVLFNSEYSTIFFVYLNSRRHGLDGAVQARNFAILVCDNPAIERLWKQANDRLEHDWVGVSNTDQDVWLQDVNRHLEQVTELRLNA